MLEQHLAFDKGKLNNKVRFPNPLAKLLALLELSWIAWQLGNQTGLYQVHFENSGWALYQTTFTLPSSLGCTLYIFLKVVTPWYKKPSQRQFVSKILGVPNFAPVVGLFCECRRMTCSRGVGRISWLGHRLPALQLSAQGAQDRGGVGTQVDLGVPRYPGGPRHSLLEPFLLLLCWQQICGWLLWLSCWTQHLRKLFGTWSRKLIVAVLVFLGFMAGVRVLTGPRTLKPKYWLKWIWSTCPSSLTFVHVLYFQGQLFRL